MPQCSALNCKNRGVHLFPKDPKRRKQWENALRIKNFRASNTSRLCSLHFKENDYFGKSIYTGAEPLAKFLKKTAVPSLFCFTEIKLQTAAALERQSRLEKRSQRKLFADKTLQLSAKPSTSKCVTIDLEAPVVGREEKICIGIEPVVTTETAFTKPEFLCKSTQVDHEHVYGSINNFKDDVKAIKFYTGFETYKKFNFVYTTLSPMAHKMNYYGSKVALSYEDQFFMTLMKLKQNKCNFELSKFFCISETTVSNIFITWVNYIYQLWTRLNIWPCKELVEYYMPHHFKAYDKNIRVILGGTEITSQKPGLSVIKDKELASKRVHIERIIGLTKTYKILKSELDHSYIPIASKIFFVCFMCCNFQECIMK